MSNVAVVILNFNGRELLKKFLPSVVQFSGQAKIVVVDNHSTDGSREFLQLEFPQVETIHLASNLGFCAGYNFALRQVKATYFILLNSDVEVTPGWLAPLEAILENDPQAGAVQPKILSYTSKQHFEYAGAGGGFIDWLGYPFCRGRIFNTLEADHHQYDDTRSVFWASGACLAVKADLFFQLGGFDESFFAHMEEIDFCWRLKRAGHKVYYCGSSTVYHVGGATLSASNSRKTYYNFRNGLAMLVKNLDPVQMTLAIPLRLTLDWLAAIKFLLAGHGRHAWAVINAHIFLLLHLSSLLKKRHLLAASLQNYAVDQVYGKSIVLGYFLFRKKKFTDLQQVNNPR